MQAELIILLLIVSGFAVAFAYRYKKNKVEYDPVKGSSTQNIYIIATQLVNPTYLDEATFLECFGELLTNKFPNISTKTLNKHIAQLYKCVTNHEYAMRLIWSGTWKLDSDKRAFIFAKAINLANHIDPTKYFIKGLKNNDNKTTELYESILTKLQINSDQVLIALEEINYQNSLKHDANLINTKVSSSV